MSVKVMSRVWESTNYQDSSTMLVLLSLADWADDTGLCWPSVPRLAKKARMSERNARYVLKRLETDGVIRIDEQRGRNHTNRYKINLQSLQVSDDENLQPSVENLQTATLKPAIAIAPEPSVEPLEECGTASPPTAAPPSDKSKTLSDPSKPYLKNDPLLKNPAIVIYRDHCRLTPNHEQRKAIAEKIRGPDLTLWRDLCAAFMQEGRPPQRVDWLLERYENARASPPEVKQETREEKEARLRKRFERTHAHA